MTLVNLVIAYLGIGVVAMVAVAIHHRLSAEYDQLLSTESVLAANPEKNRIWLILVTKVLVPVIAVSGVVVLWPLAAVMWIQDRKVQRERSKFDNFPAFAVQTSDLIARFDVTEVEAKERVADPMQAVPGTPFGHLNMAWRTFLETMEGGDCLWSFRSHWVNRWGDTELFVGYVLVSGRVIKGHFLSGHRRHIA